MRPVLAITLLCLTACVCEAAPKLRLLGSVDGSAPAPRWVYAKKGQRVRLHATLTPDYKSASLRWYRIEPTDRALDNTTPSFHYEKVHYVEEEIAACHGERVCDVDVRPRHLPEVPGLEGLGTMAFKVRVRLPNGTELSTPGLESIERGGLSKDVFRVTVRQDDTYKGYLTELLNTPYIFGSDGPAGRHQADLLIGSDCADLTVYAARRAGKDVPYVSTWTIAEHAPEVTRAVAHASSGSDFVDAKGKRVRIGSGRGEVREGDLVLFPGSRHVGVLWEDRSPKGVLDSGDLMFHTCWAPPTVEAIGASRCASLPVRILRFR